MRCLVAQLGARMHYAVPRILYEAGQLQMLHTDICAVKGWPAVLRKLLPDAIRPKSLQNLLGRVPEGIPNEKIRAYTSFGREYAMRRQGARSLSDMTAIYLWAGKAFNHLIIKHGIDDSTAVYTFNTAGLELMKEAKRNGLKAIMEQTIAPKVIEHELLAPEYASFHELLKTIEPRDSWQRLSDREAAEWDVADHILCGSQFVIDGIRKAGGPADKAILVPYGIDLASFAPSNGMANHSSEFNVLFVGEVGLRKGAHYLIEAARFLEVSHPEIRFHLVGTISLPKNMLKSLPANILLTGPVSRIAVRDHFVWADLFCLPSLCEGSATVTYEALAMGLPVICTANAGSVVTDCVDGFIIPVCDNMVIVDRVAELAADPELMGKMSRNAFCKAAEYTVGKYGIRLLDALKEGASSR